VVFYERSDKQMFTVLEVGQTPLEVKLSLPLRGYSQYLAELGWASDDNSFYFVGARYGSGGYRTLSNQVYRLDKAEKKWALAPVDLDSVMLMYLEHRRSEATRARPVANGQLITTKPELRLDGNEELFRVIGVF
jgi:hypothetical protein